MDEPWVRTWLIEVVDLFHSHTECGWPIDEDLVAHVAWEMNNEQLGI